MTYPKYGILSFPTSGAKVIDSVESFRILSDDVRHSITQDQPLSDVDNVLLSNFLESINKEEKEKTPSLDLETIKAASLDQMIADIIKAGAKSQLTWSKTSVSDIRLATDIYRQWVVRFKSDYFGLEGRRMQELIETGQLRDVFFEPLPSLEYPIHRAWKSREPNTHPAPELIQEKFAPGE